MLMEDDELAEVDNGYDENFESRAVDSLKLSTIERAWQFPSLDSDEVVRKLGKEHRAVSQYICKELGKSPLCVQLKKKVVLAGSPRKFRADVTVGFNRPKANSKAKKLRAIWSVNEPKRAAKSDFDLALRSSYEDLMSRAFTTFDLELILPKMKSKKNGGANPVILYSTPMGEGTTQEDARMSQSEGVITVFPNGRKKGGNDRGIIVGGTSAHIHARHSSVDGSWARGKKFFWKGRSVGQL